HPWRRWYPSGGASTGDSARRAVFARVGTLRLGVAAGIGMIIFVARRLAQAIPVMFLATIGVFLLLHLLPGDPAALMAGSDAPPATIEFVRHDMGLDQPLPVQYVIWLGHIARGDLGKSVFSKL